MRPCSSGSLLKSMPGTMCAVQNATCSVSAKKLSGLRSSTMRPTVRSGTSSSGTILVGSSTSKPKPSASSSLKICSCSRYSGKAPASIASQRSRRWKSASAPLILTASSHTRECVPATGLQWNLQNTDVAFGVDQAEGVDAEALHRPVAARNGAVRHHPGQHVRRLGHQRNEVPESVVRARSLGHRMVRLRLQRMDEIGKLHRVLDEEHRDVVADQVPVALVGVELDGEAADVAHRVGRSALAGDGGEADEHRRPLADFRERCGLGEGGDVARCTRRIRGPRSRGHEPRARECARGRSA